MKLHLRATGCHLPYGITPVTRHKLTGGQYLNDNEPRHVDKWCRKTIIRGDRTALYNWRQQPVANPFDFRFWQQICAVGHFDTHFCL